MEGAVDWQSVAFHENLKSFTALIVYQLSSKMQPTDLGACGVRDKTTY